MPDLLPDLPPDLPLVLAQVSPRLLYHLPIIVFVFCFGACVGSFVNVVIYRLPAGMSVITPPSRCPTCGAHLKFFRENLPVLGWFMIRGKCRYCGERVSPQYMIIELLMGLMFIGLYAAFYLPSSRMPWWGAIGGSWWSVNGAIKTAPVFIAFLFMFAGLVAMTIIDARTFTIPIQIPLFVTGAAFIAYPVQALIPLRRTSMDWPIPGADWAWCFAALAAMLGIVISCLLLRAGKLRYSFADYEDYVEEGETLGDYPHARREMGVEILFLLPCLVLFTVGFVVGSRLTGAPPHFLQAVGATLLGYLVGGGVIWAIRILGTLGFGREAMGMGDVHLLGAIGAVLGWYDPLWIFFIAPFSGIAWVLWSIGLAAIFKRARRELPYGPHLAVAALIVVLCRPGVDWVGRTILRGVPLPTAGFVDDPDATAAADNLTNRPSEEGGALASRAITVP
ncbi:MAG: prepilin peptidase [Planctomycetota bacterium]|jgi:leader peptidase (prepilin peptidase)/N-methyltransferase